MNAKQVRVAVEWAEEFAGAVWKIAGNVGKAQLLFEVGKRVVLKFEISDSLRKELESHTLVDLIFGDGKKSTHAKA